MDLVLVQQENIAGAPAGVREGARLVFKDSTPLPTHVQTSRVPQNLVGWVPLQSASGGLPQGLLYKLALKFPVG